MEKMSLYKEYQFFIKEILWNINWNMKKMSVKSEDETNESSKSCFYYSS
jgi:hypothetical protein